MLLIVLLILIFPGIGGIGIRIKSGIKIRIRSRIRIESTIGSCHFIGEAGIVFTSHSD